MSCSLHLINLGRLCRAVPLSIVPPTANCRALPAAASGWVGETVTRLPAPTLRPVPNGPLSLPPVPPLGPNSHPQCLAGLLAEGKRGIGEALPVSLPYGVGGWGGAAPLLCAKNGNSSEIGEIVSIIVVHAWGRLCTMYPQTRPCGLGIL